MACVLRVLGIGRKKEPWEAGSDLLHTHISGQALSLPSQPVHVNTYTLLSEVSSLHPTFFIMGLLGSLKNGRLQGPMQVGREKATAIIALTEAKKP